MSSTFCTVSRIVNAWEKEKATPKSDLPWIIKSTSGRTKTYTHIPTHTKPRHNLGPLIHMDLQFEKKK